MTLTTTNELEIPGICYLCQEEVPSNDSRIHAHDCIQTLVSEASPDGDVMLISAWCENQPHWLELTARPTATLGDLNHFLKRVWLRCCDHQSRFIVHEQLDLRGHPKAVDWELQNILVQASEPYLRVPMEDILDHGTEFEYQYDPTDTTKVQLGCSGYAPVPFDELHERLGTSCLEGSLATDNFVVIGRNDPPQKCEACGDVAYRRYYRDTDRLLTAGGDVPISVPPFFCDQCCPDHGPFVIMENSPRVGIRCYDAAHNEPEDDPEDE